MDIGRAEHQHAVVPIVVLQFFHQPDLGFLLNRLNCGGSAVTLAGNSLAFTANGPTLPQIHQNSANGVTISAPWSLATNITLGGSGSGSVAMI